MGRNQTQFLENSLERTARLLSHNFGIKVIFQGAECKTDGKVIYLPALPDDAPKELLDALMGFLDHEIGHIIGSDFTGVMPHIASLGIPKQHEQLLFNVINVVEDQQVENRVRSMWPGARKNLEYMYDYCSTRIRDEWDNYSAFDQVLFGLVVKFTDYNPDMFDSLMDSKVSTLVEECVEEFSEEVSQTTCTDDSIEVGKKIFEKIKEMLDEPPPPDDEEEESDENGDEENDQDTPDSGGLGDDPGENESDDSSDAPGAGGGDEEVDGGPDTASSADDLSTQMNDYLKDFLEGAIDAAMTEAGLTSESEYEHDQWNDNTYIPYTTEYDMISPVVKIRTAGEELANIRADSSQYTAVIKRKLVNSLRSSQKKFWLGGKERGRLNTRALHRVQMGNYNGLYKQKIETTALNTCVGVLVDHSGSMSRKLRFCSQLCVTFGDAFHELQVPFFVTGYTTDPYAVPVYPSDVNKLYARWCGLTLLQYVEFNKPWRENSLKLPSMTTATLGNTLEGESVKWGVQRLLAREETRKLLIVLSDGYPEPGCGHRGRCQKYFKKVVQEAGTAGVDVVGFGIQTEAVKHYFDNYVVLNELADVIREPLTYLDQYLRKGIK